MEWWGHVGCWHESLRQPAGRYKALRLVGGTGYSVECIGIIQIQDTAFLGGGVLASFFAVGPHYAASANLGGRTFQFLVNPGGKNDGMAAPSLNNRQNYGGFGRIEQLDQAIHVKDLTLPPGVKALADPEAIVVQVAAPQAEAEAPALAAEQAEPEVIRARPAAEEGEAEKK